MDSSCSATIGSACSEDNYRLLCYDMFLCVLAILIEAKRIKEARQLLDYRYVAPRTYGGNDLDSHSFDFQQSRRFP